MKRRLADRNRNQLHLEHLEERHLLTAVTGHHVFYNDSGYDDNAGIDANDSAAIDTSKSAYLADAEFTIEQLTDDLTVDRNPQVMGSQIVWEGSGGTDGGTDTEIFWYNGSTTIQLTENDSVDEFPQISAFGIAWERPITGGNQIVFWDGVSEEILTSTAVDNDPFPIFSLSDDRLAWEDEGGGDFDILSWNDTGAPVDLSQNTFTDLYPDVDGNNVVWAETHSTTFVRSVRFFNGTTTSTIGTSTFAIFDPNVDGDKVAWDGFEHSGSFNHEIYFYNGSVLQLLTNDDKNDFDPQVSGDNVVWWSNKFGVSQIHLYDGSTVQQLTNTTQNTQPQIDGQNIVWQGISSDGGSDLEIFLWNGHKVIQITDNTLNDSAPQISGNHIVWQAQSGLMGTTQEIYHTTFTNTVVEKDNVTAYSKGLNGLMVDIENPDDVVFTAADFTFRMSEQGLGANNAPSTWVSAPPLAGFTVLPDTPVAGTDRVEFIWANDTITDRYLEVIVEGNDPAGGNNLNTGLAESDIFFYGNKIGDTFTDVGLFVTDATDEINARENQGLALSPTNTYDFNKDFVVDATDQIIARTNGGLLLEISIGGGPLPSPPPAPLAAPKGDGGIAFALSASAVPATKPGSAEPASAVNARPIPADSRRPVRARNFEHLDRARVASPAAAGSDEMDRLEDVLDALLKDLLDA